MLIETMRTKENAYNSALSDLDQLYREMLETERELSRAVFRVKLAD